jgi:hypothetical protein
MKIYGNVLFISVMTLSGFQANSQDTFSTTCKCNDSKIEVIENMTALLKSMQDEVKTDDEKIQLIRELKELDSVLSEISIKCEDDYANTIEEEKCDNEEKLKIVNDEYELIIRVLQTNSKSSHH